MTNYSFLLSYFCLLIFSFSCEERKVEYVDEIYEKPAIVADPEMAHLSPEESLTKMYLPKGYRMELVASEPMIEEPVWIAWDGEGKMYVAQMRTYMQNADALQENEPWSRVSVLEDLDGDGRMDKSTVFIDSLVLPRIVLPLDDRVIIGETYSRNLWSYRDTDGDRVADEKILILEDTVRDNRNLEHQAANMIWSIDNWLYVSNNSFRFRFRNGVIERDTMPDAPNGQWGLTQDETGRLFYSRAGAEIPALGFQQHPLYGVREMEGRWEEGFTEPWPVVGTIDAQGGPRRLREGEGTLNKFTGVAGQEIFLGDKLPAYGDLFIPEPVARIVRRAKVNHEQGKIVLTNAYPQKEFLASTDPLFRPVQAVTGPDGCLYIVDMYRGIIQEGTWVGPGSYLRGVVDRKGIDKFVGKGRIYRIVHDQMTPGKKPDLSGKSADDLLSYLGHPNGWYRMTAQKMIIVKGDKAVIPSLKKLAMDEGSFWGKWMNPDKDYALQRLHALWTLEGLEGLDKNFLIQKYTDADPRVRSAAVRLSEPYLEQSDPEIAESISGLVNDPDPEVLTQLILSLRSLKGEKPNEWVKVILDAHADNEVIAVTAMENLNEHRPEIELLKKKYILRDGDTRHSIVRGYEIYKGLCAACHGPKGEGIDPIGPPLATSPRVMGDFRTPVRVLLNGLSGPLDGKNYTSAMAPMRQNDDQWIADVLNYVRAEFGDKGTIWFRRVSQMREKYKDREAYWTMPELTQEAKKDL
ncbi:MAG: c-type cytochrome [Bacteroidia bacterium]|nr:c-type cytochrome [Bacteroidia bacterium]